MNINVNIKFECTKCFKVVDHDYTQEDLLKYDHLDLTCQSCDNEFKVDCKLLIKKAKEEAMKEFKKSLDIK